MTAHHLAAVASVGADPAEGTVAAPGPEHPDPSPGHPAPVLDLVVPVYNEQEVLAGSIERLHDYLRDNVPLSARITIVDNASTDDTWPVAAALAERFDRVRAVRLDRKGRGLALRTAWSQSDAQVVAYTDVDLSTDLNALLPMITSITSGHSDLAIGTRLRRGARVVRGPRREFISRSYNLILRTALLARFSDAQCGFKAIRADLARALVPLVEDDGWFFDTELLVLAERSGLRIHEVPVDWVDDPDSRVDLVSTALADLRGVVRLLRGLLGGSLRRRLGDSMSAHGRGFGRQLTRFAGVGVASTLAYLALFAVLRDVTTALWANLAALLVTAVANTAVNRRLTFGVRGGSHTRDHLVGLAAFGVGLALTTGSLKALLLVDPAASRLTEAAVLLAANAVATVVRFLALRAVMVHAVTPQRSRC